MILEIEPLPSSLRSAPDDKAALLSSLTESLSIMDYLNDECLNDEYLDDEDFEDDEIPILSGRGEGIMDEAAGTSPSAGRRNEDIALDLMKFIAMTTGYGKTASSGGV